MNSNIDLQDRRGKPRNTGEARKRHEITVRRERKIITFDYHSLNQLTQHVTCLPPEFMEFLMRYELEWEPTFWGRPRGEEGWVIYKTWDSVEAIRRYPHDRVDWVKEFVDLISPKVVQASQSLWRTSEPMFIALPLPSTVHTSAFLVVQGKAYPCFVLKSGQVAAFAVKHGKPKQVQVSLETVD